MNDQPATPPSADMSPGLSALIDEMDALTVPQELQRKIALATEGLRRMEAGDGSQRLWRLFNVELGKAYAFLPVGNRAANLQTAVTYYQLALNSAPKGSDPRTWASAQLGLGITLLELETGGRADNFEQGIACLRDALTVFARETAPAEWSLIQNGLGIAYYRRIRGARRENLEHAIKHLEAALQVRTLAAAPLEWAMTMTDLSLAYKDRLNGDRADNLERAIACVEGALRVLRPESSPLAWANAQHNLGFALEERIRGERAENLERSIACYQAALTVRTEEAFPNEWGVTQANLGIAYANRVEGAQAENQERAIQCYENALRVQTREAVPAQWANTHVNLGGLLVRRIRGERAENIARAIAHFDAALTVYTRESDPHTWARIQVNLANAYGDAPGGRTAYHHNRAIRKLKAALRVQTRRADPEGWARIQNNLGNHYAARGNWTGATDQDVAIACYQRALRVRTRTTFPLDWAATQHNLGLAYRSRLHGSTRANLRLAVRAFRAALEVRTLDAHPAERRRTALNLATTEARRRNWPGVHDAYSQALAAEELLLRLGAGAHGHDEIAHDGQDAAIRAGYALIKLGRLADAATSIERGRARGLANARALDAADPKRIGDPGLRQRYEDARTALIEAQRELHLAVPQTWSEAEQRRVALERSENFRHARDRLDAAVEAVRAADDPGDFLGSPLDASGIMQAAQAGGPGHAIVYLVAAPWGGAALAALTANPTAGTSERFAALDLPKLTTQSVETLVETKLESGIARVLGGYGLAQQGATIIQALRHWRATTFAELARALQRHHRTSLLDALEQARLVTLARAAHSWHRPSGFEAAAKMLLKVPAIATIADKPFSTLTEAEASTLVSTFDYATLRFEVRRALQELGRRGLRAMAHWLRDQHVTSCTFIPCGPLAAFPLLALSINGAGAPQAWQTLGELFSASVAPSARAVLPVERGTFTASTRVGVFALGNPLPSHQLLPSSAAEAEAVARLAGHPEAAVVGERATRTWLLDVLRRAWVVDVSCHGQFDSTDFLRSRLLLAGGESLTLGDMLGKTVDVQGLRLIILSACQTAILDLAGQADEVRSLAAGMLEAGAQAVLAALWSVDDEATYCLMVRFAQEWFPQMDHEQPAAALARAQRWLRTVTRDDLAQWRAQVAAEATPTLVSADTTLTPRLAVQRGGGSRYEIDDVITRNGSKAAAHRSRHYPFADPFYWAGFQVIGR